MGSKDFLYCSMDFDIDGVFSYCVYEGTVTLDSVNDPQPFCIIPNDESSFENMFSNVNDRVDIYSLDQIETPLAYLRMELRTPSV